MLKNFWWAIEFSDAITHKATQVTAVGQKLVLWRDSKGKVHALSDLCAHRGGPLSGGWLKNDAIVCPYHGWEFNGEGECIKIPAQPQRGIPKKARVDSYPVQEKYGWIWVFLGDLPEEERPPIPDIPEIEDPNFRRVQGYYYWNVNYERAIENAMDPSHAAFVHGNRFGNPDNPIVRDFEVNLTDWSGIAHIKLTAPASNYRGAWARLVKKAGPNAGTADEDDPMPTKAGYYLPNINILHVPLPMGNMVLIDAAVPISENETKMMYIGMRDFLKKPWADRDMMKRIHYIFKQDDDVISGQRPEMLPYNLTDEMHVRSDALQVAYRRRRNELIEQGWGIDMHQIVGDGPRDTAYVIPSPARRNNPELARAWVHKEVASARVLGKEGSTEPRAGQRAGGEAFFEVDEAGKQEMAARTSAAAPTTDEEN